MRRYSDVKHRHWQRGYYLIPPESVAVPSGFSDYTPSVKVYDNGGGSFSHNAVNVLDSHENSITGSAIYVDGATGDDANDGTIGNPLRSLNEAIANYSEPIVYVKPGKYLDPQVSGFGVGTGSAAITRTMKILPWPGESGYIDLCRGTIYTFSGPDVTYTNCYTATVDAGTYIVIDFNEDANGQVRHLTEQASAADCNSNAGSFYLTGTTLYVRTYDDRAPDNNIVVLYGLNENLNFSPATGKNFYAERVRCFGGNFVVRVATTSDRNSVAMYNNCHAAFSYNSNGFLFYAADVVLYQCKSYYNYADCFGWQDGFGGASYGAEVECRGEAAGYYQFGGSSQCSTAHGEARVLRVGGTYVNSYNEGIRDVANSQTWNVDCSMTGNATEGVEAYRFWLHSCTVTGNGATDDVGLLTSGIGYMHTDTNTIDGSTDPILFYGVSDSGNADVSDPVAVAAAANLNNAIVFCFMNKLSLSDCIVYGTTYATMGAGVFSSTAGGFPFTGSEYITFNVLSSTSAGEFFAVYMTTPMTSPANGAGIFIGANLADSTNIRTRSTTLARYYYGSGTYHQVAAGALDTSYINAAGYIYHDGSNVATLTHSASGNTGKINIGGNSAGENIGPGTMAYAVYAPSISTTAAAAASAIHDAMVAGTS